MLFEDNDFDLNMAFFMPDIDFEVKKRDSLSNDKLVEPMEGFLRGNMFKNEYLPYKNLTYFKLNPTNEKEKLLYKVMALSFAINDLNLYLDLHPDNKAMFDIFKKYIEEHKKLSKEYQKNYGPLKVTSTTGDKYNWIDSPWPWDNEGGSLYV